MLSQAEARHLFGNTRAALQKHLYTAKGFELTVVGVLPNRFHGLWAGFGGNSAAIWLPYTLMMPMLRGAWPKGFHSNNMIKTMVFKGPSVLLSVPATVSPAQLQTQLTRLYHAAKGSIPSDVRGLVTMQPYSVSPFIHKALSHRIRLFLGMAIAAVLLAALNVLVLRWLEYLRHRATLQLERVLGAQRTFLLRRFVGHALISLLLMLIASGLLVFGMAALLRHWVGELSSVLTASALLAPLQWLLPLIVGLVILAQALPLVVLLMRGRLDGVRATTLSRADQRAGAMLLVAEITLGVMMSIIAAWSLQHAWHSTHTDIGYLNRPATLARIQARNMQMVVGNLADIKAVKTRFQLLQNRLEKTTQRMFPGRAVGLGPAIRRESGFDFPKTIHTGKAVTSACVVSASPSWLEATGVRVLAGHNFNVAHATADTVLLDARLARTLFGSLPAALGKFISGSATKPERVVGVIAPLDLHGTTRKACPVLVQDIRNNSFAILNGITVAVGRDMDTTMQAALRARLNTVLKPGNIGTVTQVRSVGELRDWLAAAQIRQARVFVVIALFAWAIALSGVWALLRMVLARQRRLTALRGALGATPSYLYRSVVGSVLALSVAGSALALLMVPWLAQQFAFLSGAQVAPFGAATWVALAVLLLAVSVVVHFPARRAARAEPAQSLHEL